MLVPKGLQVVLNDCHLHQCHRTPQGRAQTRSGCAPSQGVPRPDQSSDISDSNKTVESEASQKRNLSLEIKSL